jgi:Ni/Co efflux regulator RcnB
LSLPSAAELFPERGFADPVDPHVHFSLTRQVMTKIKQLPVVLAGCLLAGSLAGGVSAQPRMDRDWDYGRDWRDRDWDRDRGWERGRRWRGRDRDCYYERRRETNRYGDVIIRRYRVCED